MNNLWLVTGAAGFIGFHVAKRLLEGGATVVGVDNVNEYYDVRLKHARLAILDKFEGFRFVRLDVADRVGMEGLFGELKKDAFPPAEAQSSQVLTDGHRGKTPNAAQIALTAESSEISKTTDFIPHAEAQVLAHGHHGELNHGGTEVLAHGHHLNAEVSPAEAQSSQVLAHGHRGVRVIHLAAQAGVRYSLTNPHAYVESNLVGFLNVLEGCRHHGVEHLVYASSSSVYGANTAMPFSVHQNVDHPLSLYAASKKANELMAHSYSHLYGLPSSGLRFFTVYGPWGRPDMALFIFTKAILEGKPIELFNEGRMRRDFTFVDDIVEGILRVANRTAEPNPAWTGALPDPGTSRAAFKLYGFGNN